MKRIATALALALVVSGPAVAANTTHLKGNATCWGDDSRQDISCRALTEDFLMSMRLATRAEVIEAMGVRGRAASKDTLHFISNYSKGEKWGSGFINFTFDDSDRVVIIHGSLDAPNEENDGFIEFLWNGEIPFFCSDLPGSRKRCN